VVRGEGDGILLEKEKKKELSRQREGGGEERRTLLFQLGKRKEPKQPEKGVKEASEDTRFFPMEGKKEDAQRGGELPQQGEVLQEEIFHSKKKKCTPGAKKKKGKKSPGEVEKKKTSVKKQSLL